MVMDYALRQLPLVILSLLLIMTGLLPTNTVSMVNAEIRDFDLRLQSDSTQIHYVEGFLLTPGYIDLSELLFVATDNDDNNEDGNVINGNDDSSSNGVKDNDTFLDDDQGGHHHHHHFYHRKIKSKHHGDHDSSSSTTADPTSSRSTISRDIDKAIPPMDSESSLSTESNSGGTDFYMDGSALDIAVFHLPEECASTKVGCNFPELGIGATTTIFNADDGGIEEETVRYCCSADAIDMGLCAGTQFGRLILNSETFTGKHRLVNVPAVGAYSNPLKFGRFEETKDDTSGKYVVVFANCNDNGRNVIVNGTTIWKSRHGYLPGDLFGLMDFYALLFVAYMIILVWYGVTMKVYEDANIPIQSWIFATVSMGTLEVFFRAGDLFVWNEDGKRFWVSFYVGIIIGVLKRGVSRCLLVMVSLGWGVVRDDLGPIMKKIYIMGGLYVGLSTVRDIMTEVAYIEIQRISQEKEEELFDIVKVIGFVIVLIDLIFYFWIIDSLGTTMDYLEAMKQTSKLLRYLRLRCILMFSILIGVAWAVFGIVDTYNAGIVTQESRWVIDAAMEMNYLFVLIAIAVLWRPQKNAKEYAYVMELPAMSAAVNDNGDDDDNEGIIEFSGNVPSAMDSDDEEEFQDEMNG